MKILDLMIEVVELDQQALSEVLEIIDSRLDALNTEYDNIDDPYLTNRDYVRKSRLYDSIVLLKSLREEIVNTLGRSQNP